MKQASPARRLAHQVLVRIERDAAYGERALDAALKRTPLEDRDRGLATELVYGTLRRLRYLDWLLGGMLKQPLDRLAPPVRAALRLGAYQILSTRVPTHAAVYESVALLGSHERGLRGLVNAVLRRIARSLEAGTLPSPQDSVTDPIEALALESSQPSWLLRRLATERGHEAAALWAQAHRDAPPLHLRVTRRTTRDKLADKLRHAGFEPELPERFPDGLVLRQAGAVTELPGFREGELVVQDLAAQLIGRLAAPAPRSLVLDACAAPGGKSTHLAELVGENGHVLAVDLHPGRVRLIAEAASRLELKNVVAAPADARDRRALLRLLERFGRQSVDLVLVDAPCSGLGTLRRHPELARREEGDIGALCPLQDAILDAVAPLVAPEGVLVYAVCTVTREEGEDRIRAFLARHPDFRVDTPEDVRLTPFLAPLGDDGEERVLRTWPERDGVDGFFAARLVRRRESRGDAE